MPGAATLTQQSRTLVMVMLARSPAPLPGMPAAGRRHR